MVNFPDCDSHSIESCCFGFISSDTSICSTMVFPSLGNSDHVVQFPSNSQGDTLATPFHCIVYDYSHADWDGLCDHLRDVP